jgi:Tol biopolymer transport system component
VLALAFSASAAPTVTLREGTSLSVSTDRTGELLALDLAGSIWTMNRSDGWAQPVTGAADGSQHSALSPDGRLIAFEVRRGGRTHIVLQTLATGEQRNLTLGDYDHLGPAWHPDGRRIAMASNRGGDFSIWAIDIESLALQQLSFQPGDEWEPAWNKEGDSLAFVSASSRGEGLYVQIPGKPVRLVAESPDRLHAPAWRPDGSLLTYVVRGTGFSRMEMAILSEPPVIKPLTRGENVVPRPARWLNRDAFLYTADGRLRERRLDDFGPRDLTFSAKITLPPPAPAAVTHLDTSTEPRPARGITGMTGGAAAGLYLTALGDLWQVDGEGRFVRQWTNDPYVDTDPALSPDGQRLVFVSDRSGSLELWLLELGDGSMRPLTDAGQIAMEPAWSPDGRRLAYLSAAHPAAGSAALTTLDLETSTTSTVASGLPEPSAPAWLPDGSLRVAVGGTEPGRSSGALRLDPDGGAPQPVTLPPGATRPRWSPDGRYLAIVTEEGLQLGAMPADPSAISFRRLATGPVHLARWTADSRSLIWSDGMTVQRVDAAGGEPHPVPIELSWRTAAPGSALVIRAGRLFDGLGPGYAEDRDIVIRDGRIEAVRPRMNDDSTPSWDATGLTVIPGLIDLSVRPGLPAGERMGRILLGFGVTAVRETAGNRPNDTLERQESWAADRRPGPRLLQAFMACPRSAAAAGSLVAHASRLGAAAVELCPGLSGELQRAVIEVAREAGHAISSRAAFPAALLGAAEVGLYGSTAAAHQHAASPDRFAYGDVVEIAGAAGLVSPSRLSAAGLPDLARRSEIAEMPAYRRLFSDAERYWYEESWRRQLTAWGGTLSAERRTAGQSVFRAVARGVRVVPGSDAPESPWGLGLHAELRLLVDTGLQPFQVLRMATLDAARALGLADTIGRIAPGMLADLVIVEGDPLRNIEDASQVVAVVVGGRLYTAQVLGMGPGVGKLYSSEAADMANPGTAAEFTATAKTAPGSLRTPDR